MVEPQNIQRLSHRKESVVPFMASECNTPESRLVEGSGSSGNDLREFKIYPFALVLRLRVLQIVCGISAMVMGTVAFIEERGELNLGLGIPAGGATILAAGASIHTSRGFGGYRPSSCLPESPWVSLRFLGPSARVAGPLAVLWGVACSLHTAVLIQALRTLVATSGYSGASSVELMEEAAMSMSSNLAVLAAVHLALSALTISVVLLILRIDCRYDPD